MINHKYSTYINILVIILAIGVVGITLNGEAFGIEVLNDSSTYESTIFDDSCRVTT